MDKTEKDRQIAEAKAGVQWTKDRIAIVEKQPQDRMRDAALDMHKRRLEALESEIKRLSGEK